jgi:hypothetical protein
MLRNFVVAVALLAFAPIAHAQTDSDSAAQQPEAAPAPPPEVRMAIPRSEAPPRPAPAPRAAEPAQAPAAQDGEQRAVPRSRPRGDNPVIGTAVPRDEVRRQPVPPPPVARTDRDNRASGRNVYVGRPPVYNNYYYPRRYYPYGYGAFGLGYFYYDPYTWYPSAYSAYGGYGYGYPGYYPGRPVSVFDVGELRLRVSPRHAQVFVDGYFAGEVDDYDGILQAMKLESGPYHIEIVAPGYETLEFDVRINPGQKINYRGDLRRLP